jgi:hypothetical protein
LQKRFLQYPNQKKKKKKKKLKIILAETHENLFTIAKIEIVEIDIVEIEIIGIEIYTTITLAGKSN